MRLLCFNKFSKGEIVAREKETIRHYQIFEEEIKNKSREYAGKPKSIKENYKNKESIRQRLKKRNVAKIFKVPKLEMGTY
jgi:hypothetical protein